MRALSLLLVGLSGCALLETFEEPPPSNCDPRVAYYPDADGDGLGERTAVYVGCIAPDGWVTLLEPLDTDTGGFADTDTDG